MMIHYNHVGGQGATTLGAFKATFPISTLHTKRPFIYFFISQCQQTAISWSAAAAATFKKSEKYFQIF
jgi:hypothetical protein